MCTIIHDNSKCKKCNQIFDKRFPPRECLCHDNYYEFHSQGDCGYEHIWEFYHPEPSKEQPWHKNMKNGVKDGARVIVGGSVGGLSGGIVATPLTIAAVQTSAISAGAAAATTTAIAGAVLWPIGVGVGGVALLCAVGTGVKGIVDNKYVHECCDRYEGQEGCRKRYVCCHQDCTDDKNQVKITDKCIKICQKCQNTMDNDPCMKSESHDIE